LGRRRPKRNAPRTIDLDLILHSANVRRTARLTLPHPRAHERAFVMDGMGSELRFALFSTLGGRIQQMTRVQGKARAPQLLY